ncbi:MAG: hypothetical protein JXA46_19990 [Dehalococcoidales bacterium]|nr:hypothetical protein [Dehalococcoidales bacterium]
MGNNIQLVKGESVIREGRANLQTDFIVPEGGKLFLTSKRLLFIPDKFTNIKQEPHGTISIDIHDIQKAEKKGSDLSNLLAGSFRNRLNIQCRKKSYIFQVWGIDAWINSIKSAAANAPT